MNDAEAIAHFDRHAREIFTTQTEGKEMTMLKHQKEQMKQSAAYKILHGAGYRLTDGFRFMKPSIDHVVTQFERDCIDNLVKFHNFGGLLCDSHTVETGEKAMTTEPELSLEQAKNLAAEGLYPKVTEASIKDKIAHATYLEHKASTGGILTICIIEMSNGFMVHGVSAAADPRNHKAEIGQRYAFENAFKQLWQLEGYLLRCKIDYENSVEAEKRGG